MTNMPPEAQVEDLVLSEMAEAADLANVDQRLDELEVAMLRDFPVVEMPVKHTFTPGLYSREIFMPAGTLLTSKTHRTEHQYVVISGRAAVAIEGRGVEILEAGHVGITKAGTRRLLYILEDCRWITFHPILPEEHERLDLIEARIIERRELPDGSSAHDLYKELLAAARGELAEGSE